MVVARFDRHLRWLHTSLHVGGSDHQQPWAIFTWAFEPAPPDERYVEITIAGWSDSGRAAVRFYPVCYNDPGYVNSYDDAADYDDVMVTTFLVVPAPAHGTLGLTAVVTLALIAARRRQRRYSAS